MRQQKHPQHGGPTHSHCRISRASSHIANTDRKQWPNTRDDTTTDDADKSSRTRSHSSSWHQSESDESNESDEINVSSDESIVMEDPESGLIFRPKLSSPGALDVDVDASLFFCRCYPHHVHSHKANRGNRPPPSWYSSRSSRMTTMMMQNSHRKRRRRRKELADRRIRKWDDKGRRGRALRIPFISNRSTKRKRSK